MTLHEDTAEGDYKVNGAWNRREAAKKKLSFESTETKRELYQIR
ncbi:hypothetical protein [Luteolibacter sp. AS25]